MNILIAASTQSDAGWSGPRRDIVTLFDALKLHGVTCAVLYNARDAFYDAMVRHGIAVKYLPFPRAHPGLLYRRGRLGFFRRQLRAIVNPFNPDLVYAFQPYLSSLLRLDNHVPLVYFQGGGFPDPQPLQGVSWRSFRSPRRLLNDWYYGHVTQNLAPFDAVINNSKSAAVTSAVRFRVPPERNLLVLPPIRQLPLGPCDEPIRRELGVDPDATIVLSVGRITRAKGVEEFGQVAERVVRQRHDVVFVFAGYARDAEYERTIRGRYGQQVRFLGHREDLGRLYSESDIFLYLSHREGNPNAVREALAHGLPVLASRIPGNDELIDNGQQGYLVPVDDIDAVAARVSDLLDNPDERARLAVGAKRRAQEYSLHRYGTEVIGVFREVIARQVRRRAG